MTVSENKSRAATSWSEKLVWCLRLLNTCHQFIRLAQILLDDAWMQKWSGTGHKCMDLQSAEMPRMKDSKLTGQDYSSFCNAVQSVIVFTFSLPEVRPCHLLRPAVQKDMAKSVYPYYVFRLMYLEHDTGLFIIFFIFSSSSLTHSLPTVWVNVRTPLSFSPLCNQPSSPPRPGRPKCHFTDLRSELESTLWGRRCPSHFWLG